MQRRQFLTVAGAAAAATPLAAPAIAQSAPKVRWRIASTFSKSLDTIHGGAEVFAKSISEMTDGDFSARIVPAGELAPGMDALDAVSKGKAEACHTSSADHVSRDPAFALGAAVPFGPNARQMSAWLRAGGAQLLDEFYAAYDLVNLPCGATGAQMGGWFRKDLRGLADLQGVKIRISGLAGEVMAKLGAAPQQIAYGDILPALEKGAIDAAAWIGPHDDQKLGIHKVAKNYMYPGWWERGTSISLFVNKAEWDKLPGAYKSIARSAAALANETMLADYDAKNPKALREIVSTGVKLRPYPRDILEAAYRASQEIYADLYAKKPAFRKIHESQSAFRNEQVLWSRVAEMPFDGFAAHMQSRG